MIFATINCQPEVSDELYKRFLRFPPRRPLEGPLLENACWAREWYAQHGKPWVCGARLPLVMRSAGSVGVGGVDFECPVLGQRFGQAAYAVILAVSAGPEAETEAAGRWAADEPDRYFFLESYAGAVVAALLAEESKRLQAEFAPDKLLPFYCPGYPGWPVTDATPLLALLASTGVIPGVLKTLESGMLWPKKSQLALFGLQSATVVIA